jgi:hypothetical protein
LARRYALVRRIATTIPKMAKKKFLQKEITHCGVSCSMSAVAESMASLAVKRSAPPKEARMRAIGSQRIK